MLADLLTDNPLLTLFVCMAIGSVVGAVRYRGFSFGPAAVLFSALALSAWDDRLELPAVLGSLGLALFAYCLGIASGPSFFGALRSNLRVVAAVVGVLTLSAAVAEGAGWAAGLDSSVIAGIYAGSLTNTPALAAATDQLAGDPGPTIGYSVSYLGGVLVMLGAAAWALRRRDGDGDAAGDAARGALVARTVAVTHGGLPSLRDLAGESEGHVVFTRLKHESDVSVPDPDMVPEPGDLVSAVGSPEDVAAVTERLGEGAEEQITHDRRILDMRRIALSDRRLSGRRVGELGLERFGACATRVRRGDVDLMARDDLVVQQGDRIRVVAPRERLSEVARHLGDSERGPSDLNPISLSIGLAAGIALGLVPLPSPTGGTFALGAAAGPLLVGLVLGRRARTGPIVWSLPHTASQLLQQLGILVFLAVAGSRAGGALVEALGSDEGLRILGAGLVVTAVATLSLVVVGRALAVDGPRLAGLFAGAQTQPAVLAFAQERTGSDERVALAYALVFPAAMIAKILAAIMLATF